MIFQRSGGQRKPKRSIELLVLISGLFLLSLMGTLRLQQAVENRQYLQTFSGLPPAAYFAASGFLVGLAGLACGLGLWLRRRWAARLTRAVVVLAAAGYWLERLLFGASAAGRADWPFTALASLFLVGYSLLVLASPRQAAYFKE